MGHLVKNTLEFLSQHILAPVGVFCCWLVASFHFVYHQGPEWKMQSHFRAAIVFCFCCDLGGLLNAIMPVDSNIRTRTSRICPHTAEAIISIGIVLRLLENPIYDSCLVEFHKYKWQNSDQSVMFFSIISHGNEPETFLDYTHDFSFSFFFRIIYSTFMQSLRYIFTFINL